ncbi:MAG: addiction module protein [Telluria sp.]
MTTVAALAEQIQQLSASEKHELMQLLLTDSDEPLDADEAWRDEIVRRVKAIRNGEAAIRALKEDWYE